MARRKQRQRRAPRENKEREGSLSERDRGTLDLVERVARGIQASAERGERPVVELPRRGLGNVIYDPERGFLELGAATKKRTLSVGTIKSFAQTLKLMAFAKTLVRSGDFATKREAYYVSKNWGDCRFSSQKESDAILDDIEAMAALEGLAREELHFYPEAHGGSVAGDITVIDRDPESGETVEIDCRTLGQGAYTIPRSVEHLEFRTDARFVLAIETGGMFQRLHHHRFWRRVPSVLVEMAGVPTRATRRFVRRLSDAADLPVYCFTDCDPYGFANIYRTMKAGSGNAAHINAFFSVPRARFLGVTPRDISAYGLEDATHPLSAADIKRARDAIEHDPFFAAEPRWREAVEELLALGVRAEQQALAKWGLNYVIDEYLPQKLEDEAGFLP